jgi:hypothetical protein
MQWDDSFGGSSGGTELRRDGPSASEKATRCATIEGLWLIGQDAGESATTFKNTAEFSTD